MPGNFTASEILDIKVKAESYYSNGAQGQDSIINSVAAKAILENQTARFSELQVPDKDNKVVVTWLQMCGDEMDDCTSNCDITGPELDSKGKEYTLDVCKEKSFQVNREKNRTNIYTVEEETAIGMANLLKSADQFWASYALAKVSAASGINVAPQPYTFDYTNMTTNIPIADYNRQLVAYLQKVQVMNNISNGYYIDNGGLYIDFKNALFDSGNLDGKGDLERVRALNMYYDMFNFAKAGITDSTLLIDKSAVGIYTRSRNPISPTEIGGKVGITEYSIASPTLPGVRYDIYYSVVCKTGTNGRSEIWDAWKLVTEGLVAINPEACPVAANSTTYNPTGILSFTAV
jgi:hypothetical protein